MRVRYWLACTAMALALPAGVSGQSQGDWSVQVSTGAQLFAESSAIKTGAFFGLEALYHISPRFSIGPALEFSRTETDGSFFVAAIDFGADSTRVFEVGQAISALHYGGVAQFSLMPGNQFAPYVTGGAGGYTLYLETQANDGIKRVTEAMFQVGGGVHYAVTEAAGIQVDVRDVIFTNFDRNELNPIEVRHRNCPTPGVTTGCRFPDKERTDLPDEQDMIHNIRLSIGLTYIPGANR